MSSVSYYLLRRGSFSRNKTWTTDLLVNRYTRLGVGATQLFFRGVITTLFNNSGQEKRHTTINTQVTDKTYRRRRRKMSVHDGVPAHAQRTKYLRVNPGLRNGDEAPGGAANVEHWECAFRIETNDAAT